MALSVRNSPLNSKGHTTTLSKLLYHLIIITNYFFFTFQIRPALPSKKVTVDEEVDVDIDEEEDERVLVINHRENETASPEEDEDSGREDSA